MRPRGVVVGDPGRGQFAGVDEVSKQDLVLRTVRAEAWLTLYLLWKRPLLDGGARLGNHLQGIWSLGCPVI